MARYPYGLHPMVAAGYALRNDEWVRVSEVTAGAIEIESGKWVSNGGTGRHLVVGRSHGALVGLARYDADGRHAGVFDSISLRDLFVRNPRFVVGHSVHYDGADWQVETFNGPDLQLRDSAGRTMAVPATKVVDNNLEQLCSRVVLLVDVG